MLFNLHIGTGVVSMSDNAIMNVNNLTFNFYLQTTLAPATLTMVNSALCQVQVLVMNTNSFASIDDQVKKNHTTFFGNI